MASRLSEESFPAIYNSGCSGLAFHRNSFELNRFWECADFDLALSSPDPARVIGSLSPQRLYYSLLEKGPGDCLEVLALITKEQFLRILDYDVWRRDEFIPQRALYWLDLLRKVSPETAYEQFRGLEEEYQLSIMSSFIRVYDLEAYEQMTDVDQDSLLRLPGEAFFYSIESTDTDIRSGIQGLVESILASDMNYAMSLLNHAAYLPPNESVHSLEQFRKARLEEDGFVSYEESLTCFAELDPVRCKLKWQPLAHHLHEVISYSSSQNATYFLDEVLFYAGAKLWNEDQIQRTEQGLVSLANNLCSAAQIEADDIHTLKFIFTNGKALCSLGLEYLSDVDFRKGAEILSSEYPKDLFRIGFSLVRQQQRRIVNALCDFGIPGAESLRKYFVLQKFALILDWFDKNLLESIGFEKTEVLKGLFNRFPQYPKESVDESGVSRVTFYPISKVDDLKVVEEITNRMVLCFQIKSQS